MKMLGGLHKRMKPEADHEKHEMSRNTRKKDSVLPVYFFAFFVVFRAFRGYLFLLFLFYTAPTLLHSEQDAPYPVTFTDVTEEAGIQFQHVSGISEKKHLFETMGSGAAFFDYDNDGDIDLYIVNSGLVPGTAEKNPFGNVLYRNDGNGNFTDVTEIAGVGDTGYGMGVVVGDYDNA